MYRNSPRLLGFSHGRIFVADGRNVAPQCETLQRLVAKPFSPSSMLWDMVAGCWACDSTDVLPSEGARACVCRSVKWCRILSTDVSLLNQIVFRMWVHASVPTRGFKHRIPIRTTSASKHEGTTSSTCTNSWQFLRPKVLKTSTSTHQTSFRFLVSHLLHRNEVLAITGHVNQVLHLPRPSC